MAYDEDVETVDPLAEDEDTPTMEELMNAGEEDDSYAEEEPSAPPAPAGPSPEDRYQTQIENLNRGIGKYRHELRSQEEHHRAELAQRDARMEVILSKLAEASGVDMRDLVPQDPNAPTPLPDAADDPAGHIVGRVASMLQPIQERLAAQDQQASQAALQQQSQQIVAFHEQDRAAFSEQTPDFAEAEDYVAESIYRTVHEGLRLNHPEASDEEVTAAAEHQMRQLAARVQVNYAMQGKSLAQEMYRQAQARGWSPGRAKSRVDKLRRNMASASPTATARGTVRRSEDLTALLSDNISDDDFDAMVQGKDWEQLASQLLAQ